MSISIKEQILKDLSLLANEEALFHEINWDNCPKHIAFIMDGNGRWAKSRNKLRSFGHKAGVHSVYEMVDTCGRLPVEYVTFYAFSTENWKRSESEVSTLMSLFSTSLNKYIKELHEQGVRIDFIGDLSKMGNKILDDFSKAKELTKNNQRLTMTLALNYSGRADLLQAFKKIALKVKDLKLNIEDIDESVVSKNLDTKNLPDPELLIRTSGEMRLSNFLLWECAYSEFYFSSLHWPDFNKKELFLAILDYQKRQRRFGGV